jgi:hypothetical protein
MALRPKLRRAAGCATLITAMIAGAACLALAQNGPNPRAAAGIAIIPMAIPTVNPRPNPRNARPGERIRVLRIDALKGDESFAEFRDYLEGALKRRDAQAIYRVVSRDFETHSMDEDLARLSHFEQFKRTAHLEDKNTDPSFDYWRILDEAVRLGTTRVGFAHLGTAYCGPAFTTSLDDPDEHADNAFLIGDNVPMRRRPDPSSAQIASLSWEVIQMPKWTPPDVNNGYIQIVMRDGRSGWVERRFVRQSYEPAICFGREANGDWSIKAIEVNDD